MLLFADIIPADAPRVGGKAAGLARLTAAGLPVPPGFVVPTDIYQRLHATGLSGDAGVTRDLLAAYHALGGGSVAVRSSATAEDGHAASFAGQQETILGVTGDPALIAAVERCWASLQSERAVAYRRSQRVADAGLAMAVVVQQLIPAEVAGVLFTRDPADATGSRMSVEAAWGLGEAVVSGRVTPDRFAVDFASGEVIERHAGDKAVEVTPTGEVPVAADRRHVLCLTDADLGELAALGRRVEQLDGEPRDIEWARAGGRFYLLQARPITAASAAGREAVRAEVIAGLRAKVHPRGTVWVRYNLSEVLPTPTPMTWAVVQHLIGPDGGFGAMNRDLGASPDPSLHGESAFDLVAGRPMANLARLPRMQFADPPFEYPVAKYKADPRLALDPKPVLNPARDGVRAWLRLPALAWRLYRTTAVPRRLSQTFAKDFAGTTLPAFVASGREALAADWGAFTDDQLRAEFHAWTRRTLVDFARDSLKPTVFAAVAWETLVQLLTPKLGADRARAAVGELALGARPPADADLAGAVGRLTRGETGAAAFLAQFGHRGPDEMDLATPRWRDDPTLLPAHPPTETGAFADLAARVAALGTAPAAEPEPEAVGRVAAEAKLTGPYRTTLADWAGRLRVYLGLREAAKNGLLVGYAVVRKALVLLADRHHLGADIFYLLPAELAELGRTDFADRIAARRSRRRTELNLEVPPVLFGDDLEVIGRPLPVPAGVTLYEGTALSAGTADAPALVRTDPAGPVPAGPYILVCPSTDPAWVPLFANAVGLVLETGGVLSHGAIVAREFGLPAVAGVPGATTRFTTGQRLRVDGGRGTVGVMMPPE